MRIAIIADVHGNYPALVNVVEDAVANNADKFVFAGDYIFDLPFSNEVTRLLMKLENAYIVKGNKETYLSWLANDNQDNWIYNQMACVYQTFRELSPDALAFLDGLEEECRIELSPEVSLLAVHRFKNIKPSPKNNCSSSNFRKKMLNAPFTHEQFLSDFTELINGDEYKPHIDQIDANIIVYGHNHLQSYGYCGNKLIINPGSCGQPLDFNNAAPYTILEINGSELNVIEKRVTYDIESTIEQTKKSIMYEKGTIWSELVFLALRTGMDYFGIFFEIASQIASSKNEESAFFSNSTWDEAYEVFKAKN